MGNVTRYKSVWEDSWIQNSRYALPKHKQIEHIKQTSGQQILLFFVIAKLFKAI